MLTPSAQDMLDTLHNPRWAMPGTQTDLSPIALECVQEGIPGIFVASPNDPEPHGVEVWNDAKAGKYGEIGPYLAPVETINEAMTRQVIEEQTYLQNSMHPREPGPDREAIYTEMQAAFTTQGYHFSQIPQPWTRPVSDADKVYFDAGLQAFKDTIDYLNIKLAGRVVLPPLKEK